MAQQAVTGEPARPMPVRQSAWAVYDVFETAGGGKVFVAIVTDRQWVRFCEEFGFDDLARDPALTTNGGRVAARERIISLLQARFLEFDAATLAARLEGCGLPYAPIARPQDLFDDPHLDAGGGMLEVRVPGGAATRLPALPITLGGARLGVRRDVPLAGEHTEEVLREAGYDDAEIRALLRDGIAQGRASRATSA
jgi:crotonobetainyl-CoA:carnitine CoA-transferase CaiB-like acyl-CoA transferase